MEREQNLAREALRIIDEVGWIKGDYAKWGPCPRCGDASCPECDTQLTGVCIMGAFGVAVENHTHALSDVDWSVDDVGSAAFWDAYPHLRRSLLLTQEVIVEQFADRFAEAVKNSAFSNLENHEMTPVTGIPLFNDAQGTTLEDARLVLEKAAVRFDELP